jgi:hypothetical protein
MVATISPEPRLQFFANDGSFLVGGKLYTYAAGTTTPLATYTTSTGLVANTNPIILDSRGEASVWFGSSKYKFVLKTAADVEIWTQDQLQGYANADGSNAYGTWPISITGNAATATLATTATYATTAGAVTPGAAVTSITGAGLYGFTLPGGPITSTGTLTVTPPVPGASGNVMTSNGSAWVSQALGGTSNLQIVFFASSTTWTAPAGVTKVRATVQGGGGGGAYYFYDSGSFASGGPGGLITGYYTVTPGTTYTITVGTGGAAVFGSFGATGASGTSSSFSSFLSATGGTGGQSNGNIAGNSGTVSGASQITPINRPQGASINTSTSPIAWSDGYLPGAGGLGADRYAYGGVGGVVAIEYIG